jgi:hypothetical protein
VVAGGRRPRRALRAQNVIYLDLDDGRLPLRPDRREGRNSRALRYGFLGHQSLWERMRIPLLDFPNRRRYLDMGPCWRRTAPIPTARAASTRSLPAECYEDRRHAAGALRKLAQWGYDSMVIPHGTTWGSTRRRASPSTNG